MSLLFVNIQKVKSQSKGPWIAPKTVDAKKNPLQVTEAMLKDTKKLYVNTCGPCHGNKGKGDGAAAIACNPKPADHTSNALQKESDGALFWKITEGRGPMPSYKAILTETQRWQLIAYIRSLSITK